MDLSKFDAVTFHCPFIRLVQKAYGLLSFADYKHGVTSHLEKVDKLDSLGYVYCILLRFISGYTHFMWCRMNSESETFVSGQFMLIVKIDLDLLRFLLPSHI